MKINYPVFFDTRRYRTKQVIFVLMAVWLMLLVVVLYEVVSYIALRTSNESKDVRIERYTAMNKELSDSGSREKQYMMFKSDLASLATVLEPVAPVEMVLDFFEQKLDAKSVVRRVIYEADKRQTLVYVLAQNPLAFEQNLNELPERGSVSRIDILSKEASKDLPGAVIYELRVGL